MASTDEFFRLKGVITELQVEAFKELVLRKSTLFENIRFNPRELKSTHENRRFSVQGVRFRKVIFNHMIVREFEFTNCIFENCLFIGTRFYDCRFTSCSFLDCNPHRVEFIGCFVDPRSFNNCISNFDYSNIGVYLFQELLRNSRQQAQPDFADEAQFQFREWQRHKFKGDISKSNGIARCVLCLKVFGLWIFSITTGSGLRLGRLSITAFFILIAFAMINWSFSASLGLKQGDLIIENLTDAFYFSTVVGTTLGFGDITPTTTIGRIVVSLEAILGFIIFALFTSTLYRKFIS